MEISFQLNIKTFLCFRQKPSFISFNLSKQIFQRAFLLCRHLNTFDEIVIHKVPLRESYFYRFFFLAKISNAPMFFLEILSAYRDRGNDFYVFRQFGFHGAYHAHEVLQSPGLMAWKL